MQNSLCNFQCAKLHLKCNLSKNISYLFCIIAKNIYLCLQLILPGKSGRGNDSNSSSDRKLFPGQARIVSGWTRI